MGNVPANVNLFLEVLRYLGSPQIKYDVSRPSVWIKASCPFAKWTHERGVDRRPSFGINTNNGVFNCLACGIKGHIRHLPRIWKKITGVNDPTLKAMLSANEFIPRLYCNIAPKKPKYINDIPFPLYKGNMFSKRTIHVFSLRYDPSERRLVIPIRYYNNRVVALKGRYLGKDKEIEENMKYRYYKELGGTMPHSLGIWFGYHRPIDPNKPLVLVEGERDQLALFDAGVANVWASGGAEISNAQLSVLRKCEAKTMVLFLDNDQGGERATERILEKLKGFIKFYRVSNYLGCKDPAEAVERGILKQVLATMKEV